VETRRMFAGRNADPKGFQSNPGSFCL
jgi:hypothetical protein